MEGSGRRVAVVRLLQEAGIVVGAYLAYEGVRRLVVGDSHDAFGHAFNIVRLEQEMGIFFEPKLQQWIVGHDWLVTIFNWVYIWGYLPVIAVAALYLYTRHRDFYTRYRNAFLLSGALGLVIFAMLPVAPPRMLPEFGFVDTVHLDAGFYRDIQQSDFVNEFAAVPSFHFGWILLVGIALIQTSHSLAVRLLGVFLPVMMLLAILITGNHYVIDAVIGGALVVGALLVVRMTERLHWPARPSSRWHSH